MQIETHHEHFGQLLKELQIKNINLKFSIPRTDDNPTFINDYAISNLKSVSYEDVRYDRVL